MASKKESIKRLRKQQEKEKEKMLSYAKLDYNRRVGKKKGKKKKTKKKEGRIGILSISKGKKQARRKKYKPQFNLIRQGESMKEVIKRLIGNTFRR